MLDNVWSKKLLIGGEKDSTIRYMAVINSGDSLIGSTDGLKWSLLPALPFTTSVHGLIYFKGINKWAIRRNRVSFTLAPVAYTVDGNTWEGAGSLTHATSYIWAGDNHIITPVSFSTDKFYISQGADWKTIDTNVTATWTSGAYNPYRNRWVIIARRNGKALYSSDAETFTETAMPNTTTYWNAAVATGTDYSSSAIYAVGEWVSSDTSSTTVAYALNGNVWYEVPTTVELVDVTYSSTAGTLGITKATSALNGAGVYKIDQDGARFMILPYNGASSYTGITATDEYIFVTGTTSEGSFMVRYNSDFTNKKIVTLPAEAVGLQKVIVGPSK